jgi:starch-binding outer membrane protein, SusD/RagB family
MKKTIILALCASSLGLGACGLEVSNLNNIDLELLENTPTRSSVVAATTGLLIGNRAGKAAQNGYVAHMGLLGRESYTFDAADPRFVTEMLAGASLDPGSPAFGGNLWAAPYANIRNANTVLAALEKVNGLSDAEKEAIRGFAKTTQALEFLAIVSTRDTNGGPIDVGGDINKLAPIVGKEAMLAHTVKLLDEGQAHLENGGAKFPFPLSSGYEGFATPATYLRFNRAVKARAEAYRQNWSGVLAALNESFLDTDGPLTLGVYYAFGAGSGDTTNSLTSPNIFAHPSIVPDADRKANGAVDDRVTRKIKEVPSRTYQGLSSKYMFTMYETNTAPVPIIRNEELILLRAEAHIGQENFAAAAEDLNFIRATSGGLEARADLDASNIVDELLKQRRYSLLFEGGHRWIDMRRYGKLNELPLDAAGHKVHDMFPIPAAETDARRQ